MTRLRVSMTMDNATLYRLGAAMHLAAGNAGSKSIQTVATAAAAAAAAAGEE